MTLKAARVNAGLTQQEAAKLIGVSKDTVKNWECHKSYPSADKLPAVLDTYKVKYDDINFLPVNYT